MSLQLRSDQVKSPRSSQANRLFHYGNRFREESMIPEETRFVFRVTPTIVSTEDTAVKRFISQDTKSSNNEPHLRAPFNGADSMKRIPTLIVATQRVIDKVEKKKVGNFQIGEPSEIKPGDKSTTLRPRRSKSH